MAAYVIIALLAAMTVCLFVYEAKWLHRINKTLDKFDDNLDFINEQIELNRIEDEKNK